MKHLFKILIIIFIILLPVMALADTIYLIDGSIIKGEIIGITDTSVIIKTEIGTLEIDKTLILKIVFDEDDTTITEDNTSEDNTTENDNVNDEDDNWNNEDNQENNDWNDEDDNWNNEDNQENNDWNDEDDSWNNEDNWEEDDYDSCQDKDNTRFIFSIGVLTYANIPYYDSFSAYNQYGISLRIMNTTSPFSLSFNLLFSFEGIIYELSDYDELEWYVINLEVSLRVPKWKLTPFISSGLSLHMLDLYDYDTDYTLELYELTLDFTLGLELFIADVISLQFYIKKPFPSFLFSISYLDTSFYIYDDESNYSFFEDMKIGMALYLNL